MTKPDESDIIVVPAFDDRVVRRAMRRGVVRTGLIAAVCLALILALVAAATSAISWARGDRFFTLAVAGTQAAHPEYAMAQDGTCCGAGPLGGMTNLGLESSVTLRIRPLGALNYSATGTVTVTQSAFGTIEVGPLEAATPLGDALRRGRPSKAATSDFARDLPDSTIVSALIEFADPMRADAFGRYFAATVPVREVSDRGVTVYLTDPYEPDALTWRYQDLAGLDRWAAGLRPSYDEDLRALGLPSSSDIQAVARDHTVVAFVAVGISLASLAVLLGDPAVRSVNVMDVAFNMNRQTLP